MVLKVQEYIPHFGEFIDPYEEFGKTVFAGFVSVRPQGVAKVSIKYRVPVNFDKEYRLINRINETCRDLRFDINEAENLSMLYPPASIRGVIERSTEEHRESLREAVRFYSEDMVDESVANIFRQKLNNINILIGFIILE